MAGEAYTHTRGESSAQNGHRVNAPRPPQFPEPIRDRKDRTAPVGRTHRFCTRVSLGEQSRHERRWQVPSRRDLIAAVDCPPERGLGRYRLRSTVAHARARFETTNATPGGPPGNMATNGRTRAAVDQGGELFTGFGRSPGGQRQTFLEMSATRIHREGEIAEVGLGISCEVPLVASGEFDQR